MNFKKAAILLIIFIAGIVVGGYLFRDVQPRSFLKIDACNESCLNSNELLGLIGSVGIQNLPDSMPFVVKETDKTVVCSLRDNPQKGHKRCR